MKNKFTDKKFQKLVLFFEQITEIHIWLRSFFTLEKNDRNYTSKRRFLFENYIKYGILREHKIRGQFQYSKAQILIKN